MSFVSEGPHIRNLAPAVLQMHPNQGNVFEQSEQIPCSDLSPVMRSINESILLLSFVVCSTDLEDQREELRQRRAETEERSASSARDMRATDPRLRSVILFALIAMIAVSLCQMSSCLDARVSAGQNQASCSQSSSSYTKPYVASVFCAGPLSACMHTYHESSGVIRSQM